MATDLTVWQAEHAEWDRRNFPYSSSLDNSLHGVFEECGELAHAHLKVAQGIRGTKEELTADAQDAVGDAVVYLMGVADHSGLDLSECVERAKVDKSSTTDTVALHRIGVRLGILLDVHLWWKQNPTKNRVNMRGPIGDLFRGLQRYCELQGWDIFVIVEQTWTKVKQRDWIADPMRGGETH